MRRKCTGVVIEKLLYAVTQGVISNVALSIVHRVIIAHVTVLIWHTTDYIRQTAIGIILITSGSLGTHSDIKHGREGVERMRHQKQPSGTV